MADATNSYPKMITTTIVDSKNVSHTVPAIYPPGHSKQFSLVIVANAAEEATANAAGLVAPFSSVSGGTSGSWENRHGGK